MKIINIVDEFYPYAGYENNVLSKYFVQFGHEYCILTTNLQGTAFYQNDDDIKNGDAEFMKRTGVRVIRVDAYRRISGRAVWKMRQFENAVHAENPDVLFFCGNDTLIAMLYLMKHRKLPYCVIMDSHMLEMASVNKFNKLFRRLYRKFITPIIIKKNIKVIRQQNDDYVERCLGIPLSQAPWISFGTDTLLFHRDGEVRKKFREEQNIAEEDFVFVCTGKLDESKGGKLLAEAFAEKFAGDKKVVLLVVGTTDDDEYGKEVERLFSESENRVLRFPTQKYVDLPKFYQAADVSVFAKQCSLSFYDAQACGLPVLSEDNNINMDRNSHSNGFCFTSGDVEYFRNMIQYMLDISCEEYRKMSDAAYDFATNYYNYEDKAREYEAIIGVELKRFEEKRK